MFFSSGAAHTNGGGSFCIVTNSFVSYNHHHSSPSTWSAFLVLVATKGAMAPPLTRFCAALLAILSILIASSAWVR